MATFNSKAYWMAQRKKTLESFLETRMELDDKGFKRTVINYFSGDIKNHFEKVFKAYRKHGILREEVIEMMAQTGITKADIIRQLKGKAPMLAVEFFEYNKAMGVDNNGNITMSIHTHRIEMDRIIIRRNVYPQFYININIDDVFDYDCDLSKYHKEKFKEKRVWMAFKNAMFSYFTGSARQKINSRKFFLEFKKKLYSGKFNNEVKHY